MGTAKKCLLIGMIGMTEKANGRFSIYYYSGISDISHIQDVQPSSNSDVCRVTIIKVWEIPLKILSPLYFPIPRHSADLNSTKANLRKISVKSPEK